MPPLATGEIAIIKKFNSLTFKICTRKFSSHGSQADSIRAYKAGLWKANPFTTFCTKIYFPKSLRVFKNQKYSAWWCIPGIPVSGVQGNKTVSLRPVWAMYGNPVSKIQTPGVYFSGTALTKP